MLSASGEIDLSKLPAASPQKDLTYAKDIKPLFEASRFRCHGEKEKKGGLRLDSLEAVLKGGKEGKVVEAGNAVKSALLISVSQLDPENAMPPKPRARKPGQGGPGGPGGPWTRWRHKRTCRRSRPKPAVPAARGRQLYQPANRLLRNKSVWSAWIDRAPNRPPTPRAQVRGVFLFPPGQNSLKHSAPGWLFLRHRLTRARLWLNSRPAAGLVGKIYPSG